jgi:EAL domain-containing protein (putative c-di-GMP-specific phosphodiesterase class I)
VDDLRGAAARGELRAHYQPLVALPSRRTVGVEALARWQHPEFGPISPADFIPAAEKAGLIIAVGRHILELALRQTAAWHAVGLRLDLSVNVSPTQLIEEDYCDGVSALLEHCSLTPEVLTLEITETEPIHDLPAVVECLGYVRDLGVGISIDDFGAGHTSVEQFRNLPATELKIDQSIIQGPLEDAEAALQAVLPEGRGRGIRIVAEGVETPSHLKVAEALGCDRAQGYLLGAPADADTIERVLT